MNPLDSNKNAVLDPLELAGQENFHFGNTSRDGALNLKEFSRIQGVITLF